MRLIYQKYQNKNEDSKAYGKWYARAVINENVGIDLLATKMQDNCTVKRADILAVLSELGPTMTDLLQDCKRVTIPYLGSFKLGISTTGADSPELFNVKKNVKNVHVIFQPVTHVSVTGVREKEMINGVRLVEDGEYDSPESENDPEMPNP
jgi:predicted histone-like DNA-binding protein